MLIQSLPTCMYFIALLFKYTGDGYRWCACVYIHIITQSIIVSQEAMPCHYRMVFLHTCQGKEVL